MKKKAEIGGGIESWLEEWEGVEAEMEVTVDQVVGQGEDPVEELVIHSVVWVVIEVPESIQKCYCAKIELARQ